MRDCRLHDHSTVVIIGGGPGGTACAIKLLQGARSRGLCLRVLIFEGKDFNVHANQCVGVLSPPIEEVLARDLDVHLPRALIKQQIFGYRLHGERENVLLMGHSAHASEAGHGQATYAVERAEFDRFLHATFLFLLFCQCPNLLEPVDTSARSVPQFPHHKHAN